MTVSNNMEIGIGNLVVSDFEGCETVEDCLEIIKTQAPTLGSEEEVQEWLDGLDVNFSALTEGLKTDEDEIDVKLGTAVTDAAIARCEYEQQIVEEALETLELLEDATEEYGELSLKLNITSSEDISWEHDTDDLNKYEDGDVINIIGTGTSSRATMGLGLEDEDAALTDTNGDGFITYEDSVTTPDANTYFAGQDFFGKCNAGDRLSLVSHTPPTTTFELATTIDGEPATLTLKITGDMNLYWQGSDFVDLDSVRSWPTDLLERCHDFEDTNNWQDRLFGDDVSIDERLSYIPGYEDTVSLDNLSSIITQYGLGTVDSAQFTAILKDLYSWIDDTSSDKQSLEEVWTQIYSDNGGELSPDLVSALVYSVAMHGEQSHFQTFFAPVITKLETSLGYDPLSEEDTLSTTSKATMLLLEAQSGGAGQLGGASLLWTQTFASEDADGGYLDGLLKNHDTNVAAIQQLQSLYASISWAAESGAESVALQMENAAKEDGTDENGVDINPTVQFTSENNEYFVDMAWEFATHFDFGVGWQESTSGITCLNLKDQVLALAETLQESGKMNAEEMRAAISSHIDGLPELWKDDVASLFLYMLSKENPSLFDALILDTDWVTSMKKTIDDNDGSKTNLHKVVLDLLSGGEALTAPGASSGSTTSIPLE